jgi:hypothetical protein
VFVPSKRFQLSLMAVGEAKSLPEYLSGALGYVLGLTQKHFNNKLVFAPGKPFHHSLMFVDEAKSLPEYLSGAIL